MDHYDVPAEFRERALEAGVKLAGCSVHFVRPDVDTGPIIAQAAVPVLPDDTPDSLKKQRLALLQARIRQQADAISAAARQVAETLGAAAIVTYTTTGSTTWKSAAGRHEPSPS